MEIFVFGSNRQGRHGRGAAAEARRYHGALYGQPEGLQGASYGIITKELRHDMPPVEIDEVRSGVTRFLSFARLHPEHSFAVTPIGCGLAGFKPAEIAPMFTNAPMNVLLPWLFTAFLQR
jgi:hypothetical protein